MERKLSVGLAGMPASGKSLVRKYAKRKGFSTIVMGDVIREEAKKRGFTPTPDNLGKVMLQIREEDAAIVAKRCITKIKEHREDVIIDGIRSLDEVEEFKKHLSNFILVAIQSSPKTRFRRIIRRNRADDPKTWTEFEKRDSRELSVGLGDVIAIADRIIINEGTKEELKKETSKILFNVRRR
jgi:dephospho-CoA kinase